jgi:hypothetical protein
VFQDNRLQRDAALRWLHAPLERLKHGIADFTENVELQLLKRGVSNPHRRRLFVPRQPRDDELG